MILSTLGSEKVNSLTIRLHFAPPVKRKGNVVLTMPAELISIAFLFLMFVIMFCVIKMFLAVMAFCSQNAITCFQDQASLYCMRDPPQTYHLNNLSRVVLFFVLLRKKYFRARTLYGSKLNFSVLYATMESSPCNER